MAEESKPTTAVAKSLPSLLESVVEMRFLLLIMCFAFYLDIWLVKYQIDPTALPLSMAYQSLLSASVFSLLMFICSYSLLMVGFFPFIRKVIPIIRLYLQSSVRISNYSKEEKQLANWSMAFVCLSTYSFIYSFFSVQGEYRGLADYILGLLESNGVGEIIFRLCTMFLWIYCLTLALSVDDDD